MEKTFEELAKKRLMDLGIKSMGEKINVLSVQELLVEFGKKVREATIAECVEIIFDKWNNAIPVIRDLPTDRIKTEK